MKWLKEDGDDLVPIDMFEANDLMQNLDRRRVALTETDDWQLSTVFLGYDNTLGMGTPECYQTAIKRPNGRWDELQVYATRSEAETGHQAIARLLQSQAERLILAAVDLDATINEEIRRCHERPERNENRDGDHRVPGDRDRGPGPGGVGAPAGDEPQNHP